MIGLESEEDRKQFREFLNCSRRNYRRIAQEHGSNINLYAINKNGEEWGRRLFFKWSSDRREVFMVLASDWSGMWFPLVKTVEELAS